MAVLGLDVGTTGVKAIAYDEEGRRLASSHQAYPLIRARPGFYETDPTVMADAIRTAIGQTAAEAVPEVISAIACSALGEAVLPVDRKGEPLFNTILALDNRAGKQVKALSARIDAAGYFAITGQALHPITTLAKILWWREEAPDVFCRCTRFLCWNDMTALLLGMEPAISPSLAARTGLFDLRSGTWSDRLMDLAGLEEEQLARIVHAGCVIDRVGRREAEELGLARDCVYVSGGWDQACAALGSGAVSEGIVVDSLGSTDSLNATYRGTRTDEEMRKRHLTCTPAAFEGHHCTNAFSLTGGNLLAWFRDIMDTGREGSTGDKGRAAFDRLVADALESRKPVMVLPHFAGSGTPHMDAGALGVVLGLSLATEKRDIALGIIEGVALEMALNLEALEEAGIPVGAIHAGSGGARNRAILQLRADVFGRPIVPLETEEAGCLAAGMLALSALGGSIEELVHSWVSLSEPLYPRPERAASYRRKREAYRRLYPALAELNRLAAEFQAP